MGGVSATYVRNDDSSDTLPDKYQLMFLFPILAKYEVDEETEVCEMAPNAPLLSLSLSLPRSEI